MGVVCVMEGGGERAGDEPVRWDRGGGEMDEVEYWKAEWYGWVETLFTGWREGVEYGEEGDGGWGEVQVSAGTCDEGSEQVIRNELDSRTEASLSRKPEAADTNVAEGCSRTCKHSNAEALLRRSRNGER